MKRSGNNIFAVWFTSFYLLMYVVLLQSGFGLQAGVFMFSLSPIFIIWMVISVLKDDYRSKKTFDEYFYEDMDIKRGN